MKIVLEPSCATVVAAVLKDSRFKDKKVCCIISGGNVDLSVFFENLHSKIKKWLSNDKYIWDIYWMSKKEYDQIDYNNFHKIITYE